MSASTSKGLKIFLVLAVLGGGAYFALNGFQSTAKVVRVGGEKAINIVPGSVVIQAEFSTELKSDVAGRILTSELDPGKAVKKGDVLVRIDPADVQLELERAVADLEAAKKRIAVGSEMAIQLEQAKADLIESERLFKEGTLSDSLYQKQKRALQSIQQKRDLEKVQQEAELESLSITERTTRRRLEKMTLIADYDGVVSKVYSRPGELISGGAPIALIIATNRTVEARISEENFAGVQLGQRAIVRLLGQSGRTLEGEVIKILPTADPVTQRYIVHLKVNAELASLIPGSTGDASIIIAERESPTVIPRRAVFNQKVWLVRDGKATRQVIEPGFVGLNKIEILKGVSPGDLVIVEELDKFREGEKVRVAELK